MNEDYKKGFADAVAKCKTAVLGVSVQYSPPHDPFSQAPVQYIDRPGAAVQQECWDRVSEVKP